MGGEAAVQMYKNSLILRICMTEMPFPHKKAFSNVKTNFLFHEQVAEILFKIINCKGILNVGGKTQTVYDFAKKYNLEIKTVVRPENEDDSYEVKKEAYSGPGVIINSEYLNNLKVPEETLSRTKEI